MSCTFAEQAKQEQSGRAFGFPHVLPPLHSSPPANQDLATTAGPPPL